VRYALIWIRRIWWDWK